MSNKEMATEKRLKVRLYLSLLVYTVVGYGLTLILDYIFSVAQTTILYDCSAHRPFGLRQLLHPDSPTAFSNSN